MVDIQFHDGFSLTLFPAPYTAVCVCGRGATIHEEGSWSGADTMAVDECVACVKTTLGDVEKLADQVLYVRFGNTARRVPVMREVLAHLAKCG